MFGRILRALGATCAALVVWVGMPAGLYTFGHNPWPALTAFVHDPMMRDDGTLLLAVITIVGWAAWGYLIVGLLIELVARVSGRGVRVPGLGPAQWLASIILAAIATTSVASSIVSSRAGATHHPAAVSRPAAVIATIDSHDGRADEKAAVPATSEPYVTHVVQRGETMLDLAERYYHTADAITRIIDANIGRPQPDRRSLQPDQVRIFPGWTLRIPSPAAHPSLNMTGTPQVHLAAQSQASMVYQTRHGDYLWYIAERFLGDAERYPEIAACNPGLITDPDLIEPGWQLTLPADAHDGGSRAHATGHFATPATEREQANPTPPQATMPPDALDPTPTPETPAPQLTTPATTQTPPHQSHDASEHTDQTDQNSPSDPAAHVALPSGGWITTGLAVAITTAVVLGAINRRRRYKPQFPIPISHTPTEPPLSDDLRTIADAGLTELHGMLTANAAAEHQPATTTSVAITDGSNDISLHQDLTGLTVLTGPGAPGASRAIIAAAVSSSIRRWGKDQAELVTDTATIVMLLGDTPVPQGVQRLTIAADAQAAVETLEHEVIYRSSYLAMYGADDITGLHTDPDHDPLDLCVWIGTADPNTAPRIAEAARQGHRLGVDIFILGDLPGQPAVHIAEDGHLSETADQPVHPVLANGRIATLAPANLAEILATLAAATEQPEPDDTETRPSEDGALDLDGGDPTEIPDEVTEQFAPPQFAPTREQAAPVTLRVLGPLSMSTPAVDHITFGRSWAYPLLALLAAHPQGRTLEQVVVGIGIDQRTRDQSKFANMTPEQRAKVERKDDIGIARSTITAIRTGMRTAGARDGTVHLRYEGDVYRLDPDTVEIDLWRMHAHMANANTASSEQAAIEALECAVACYGGHFADEIDKTWATDRANLYRSQVLDAYNRLVELLETDQPERALSFLHDAIEIDVVNESLYQTMMRIHGRQGRLDAIERTMAMLQDRLMTWNDSAEPSPATLGVYARMKATCDATTAR